MHRFICVLSLAGCADTFSSAPTVLKNDAGEGGETSSSGVGGTSSSAGIGGDNAGRSSSAGGGPSTGGAGAPSSSGAGVGARAGAPSIAGAPAADGGRSGSIGSAGSSANAGATMNVDYSCTHPYQADPKCDEACAGYDSNPICYGEGWSVCACGGADCDPCDPSTCPEGMQCANSGCFPPGDIAEGDSCDDTNGNSNLDRCGPGLVCTMTCSSCTIRFTCERACDAR